MSYILGFCSSSPHCFAVDQPVPLCHRWVSALAWNKLSVGVCAMGSGAGPWWQEAMQAHCSERHHVVVLRQAMMMCDGSRRTTEWRSVTQTVAGPRSPAPGPSPAGWPLNNWETMWTVTCYSAIFIPSNRRGEGEKDVTQSLDCLGHGLRKVVWGFMHPTVSPGIPFL